MPVDLSFLRVERLPRLPRLPDPTTIALIDELRKTNNELRVLLTDRKFTLMRRQLQGKQYRAQLILLRETKMPQGPALDRIDYSINNYRAILAGDEEGAKEWEAKAEATYQPGEERPKMTMAKFNDLISAARGRKLDLDKVDDEPLKELLRQYDIRVNVLADACTEYMEKVGKEDEAGRKDEVDKMLRAELSLKLVVTLKVFMGIVNRFADKVEEFMGEVDAEVTTMLEDVEHYENERARFGLELYRRSHAGGGNRRRLRR